MPQRLTRGPIRPVWGYFYELYTDDRDPDMVFNDIPVEGKRSFEMEDDTQDGLVLQSIGSTPLYYGFCCQNNSTKRTRYTFDRVTGFEIGSVAWCPEFVCNIEIALKLLRSQLVGIQIERANIAGNSFMKREWYRVFNEGDPAFLRLRPASPPIRCWKCSARLDCATCGQLMPECRQCQTVVRTVHERNWKGEGDTRIVIDAAELNYPDNVIDPSLWNGSDFFGSHISHRMLEILIAIGARPFRVIPVPINGYELTEPLKERLEAMRQPLQ